jgi:hypothetical protein
MTETKRYYATSEAAQALMARLNKLGIAAKITVNADGRFEVEPPDGKHVCHWPGCDKHVPPAMWGCKAHWFTLPKTLRDRIWATYRRGQEVTKTPSPEYMKVALEVQEWIRAFKATMKHNGSKSNPEGNAK